MGCGPGSSLCCSQDLIWNEAWLEVNASPPGPPLRFEGSLVLRSSVPRTFPRGSGGGQAGRESPTAAQPASLHHASHCSPARSRPAAGLGASGLGWL